MSWSGSRASWVEVLAVYAVKTAADPTNGQEAVTMTDGKKALLRQVSWDMNQLSSFTSTILGEGDEEDMTTLYITVTARTASCLTGSDWFKERGQWQDNSCTPNPGDILFFDWDNKGSFGPQNGVPDHVGIVERVENGRVYTIKGNSSDQCR